MRLCELDSNNRWDALLAWRASLDASCPTKIASEPEPAPEPQAPGAVRRVRHPENRPLSPQIREKIIRLSKLGTLSAREIGEQFGTTEWTVRDVCRRQSRPPRRQRFTDEDLARARALRESGRTLIQIGEELGFCRDTIATHLRAHEDNNSG